MSFYFYWGYFVRPGSPFSFNCRLRKVQVGEKLQLTCIFLFCSFNEKEVMHLHSTVQFQPLSSPLSFRLLNQEDRKNLERLVCMLIELLSGQRFEGRRHENR